MNRSELRYALAVADAVLCGGQCCSRRDTALREVAKPVRVLFLTKNFSNNSTGRTYSLWLMCKRLGWDAEVLAPVGEMWDPLVGSDFDAASTLLAGDPSTRERQLNEAIDRADLVIPVKPLPGSFGLVADRIDDLGAAVLLDIDDPDLEAAFARPRTFREVARRVIRFRRHRAHLRVHRSLVEAAGRVPVLVSNPVLQRRYGGTIVPHARVDSGPGVPHTSTSPRVVFVGTNRAHKGVDLLRHAIDELSDEGFTLTVTDDAPEDAKPWESWVGGTTFADGIELVKRGDIVVLPSGARDSYAHAQLPAKLMDAMLAGRGIIVSDLEPMTWALGSAGLSFPTDDRQALVDCLRQMADPARRSVLGTAARERALQLFEVSATTPAFEAACTSAIEASDGVRGLRPPEQEPRASESD